MASIVNHIPVGGRILTLSGERARLCDAFILSAAIDGHTLSAQWTKPLEWQRRLGGPIQVQLRSNTEVRHVCVDRLGDVVECGEALDARSYFDALLGIQGSWADASLRGDGSQVSYGNKLDWVAYPMLTGFSGNDVDIVASFAAVGAFLTTGVEVLVARTRRDTAHEMLDCVDIGGLAGAALGAVVCVLARAESALGSDPERPARVVPFSRSGIDGKNRIRA